MRKYCSKKLPNINAYTDENSAFCFFKSQGIFKFYELTGKVSFAKYPQKLWNILPAMFMVREDG